MSSETLTASNGIQAQEAEEAEKVGVGIYLTLLCHVLLFRCLLQNARCISLARCF